MNSVAVGLDTCHGHIIDYACLCQKGNGYQTKKNKLLFHCGCITLLLNFIFRFRCVLFVSGYRSVLRLTVDRTGRLAGKKDSSEGEIYHE